MAAEKLEMLLRGAPADTVARIRSAEGAPAAQVEALLAEGPVRGVLDKTFGALEAPTIAALLDPQARPVYTREPIGAATILASAKLR